MPDTLDGDSPAPDQPSGGLDTLLGDDTEAADDLALGPSRDDVDPIHIGRYVVLRRVGEGGMGVVYAAYDNELDRRVAIKLVPHSRARVKREAQAMARLSHPNVVQVYEVGEFEHQVYVAMEFVTGPTLSAWTRALPPSPTRWREILAKYIDVGRGLAAAHAARLVHRDFKPANAIVGDDGRVRVLDFGIARASEAESFEPDEDRPRSDHVDTVDPLSTPLTRTGALVGTPAYMSPEQFERRVVDARSDQFSFCIALYEALYGERPFAGETTAALVIELLAGNIRPAPPRSEVPSWVRDVLVRGLSSDPARRWPSMTELLDTLAQDPEQLRRRRVRRATWISITVLAVLTSGWFARVQMRAADEAEREAEHARELEAIAAAREAQAQAERDQALHDAQAAARQARDTARVLAARGLHKSPDVAAALLRDTEHPEAVPGWRSAAVNALQPPVTHELLDGHTSRVAYLDVSLDNRWIASSSFDGSARLWPRAGGPPLVLQHGDHVLSASFSRNSDKLVTASRDGTARVYALPPASDGPPPTELDEPIVLRGHEEVLWSAQFSNDGSKVVTASRDDTVRVWSLDQPEQPRVLSSPGINWWAEFSPNQRWVVAASSFGYARLWSLDDPEREPIELVGHTDSVGDVHFSPTMDVIVTASSDGTARVYRFDPAHTGPLEAFAVLDHDGPVVRTRFSLDGMRLVTASRDRSAKVWTFVRSGQLSGEPLVFDTGDDSHLAWEADFSPDGLLLAIGRGDGVIQVHPLRGGPPLLLRGHTADVFRVRFTIDNQRLISASSDGTLRTWSTAFPQAARTLDVDGRVTDMLARGRVLASASTDGNVRVWAAQDPGLAPIVSEAPAVIGGHQGRPLLALDAFPRLLASADDVQADIRLWRITGTWVLDRERPLARLTTPAPIRSMALDDGGRSLAASLMDGSFWLWTLGEPGVTVEPVAHELGHHSSRSAASTAPVFSPDGRRLVVGATDDYALELWELDDLERPPTQLPGHTNRVFALQFSPDGRRLVSAGSDQEARVWNLDAPEQPPIVLEHPYFVYAAAFDPNAERVLTGCGNTNAYLWTLADPSNPVVLSGASGEVRDVAFSPDGRWLATASSDGRVLVWSVDGGEPIEFDTGTSLGELEFLDDGRRIAAAGFGPSIWLWYLGAELDIPHLQERLTQATRVCPSPAQRHRYIGESLPDATAAYQICVEGA